MPVERKKLRTKQNAFNSYLVFLLFSSCVKRWTEKRNRSTRPKTTLLFVCSATKTSRETSSKSLFGCRMSNVWRWSILFSYANTCTCAGRSMAKNKQSYRMYILHSPGIFARPFFILSSFFHQIFLFSFFILIDHSNRPDESQFQVTGTLHSIHRPIFACLATGTLLQFVDKRKRKKKSQQKHRKNAQQK